MHELAELLLLLELARESGERIRALQRYLERLTRVEQAVALGLLLAPPSKRLVQAAAIWLTAIESLGVPEWLLEESLAQTGDKMETVTLLTGQIARTSAPLSEIAGFLETLERTPAPERAGHLIARSRSYEREVSLLLLKLATGSLRPKITRSEVALTLSVMSELPVASIGQRLLEPWKPTAEHLASVLTAEVAIAPREFALAEDASFDFTEEIAGWQFERHLPGLRAQIIKQGKDVVLWSRDREVVTDRFEEIARAALDFPSDVTLDGQIVAWESGEVQPLSHLQRRLTRKPSEKLLREVPVLFFAYDLLTLGRDDLTHVPLSLRRERLEETVSTLPADSLIQLSPLIDAVTWEQLKEIVSAGAVIAKDTRASYHTGRAPQWRKLSGNRRSISTVLMYAERASGGKHFVSFSFGVWHRKELVPVAKIPIELSGSDMEELEAWIYEHTLEKFGPVRTVPPVLVFELEFESLEESSRHKAGVVLRKPRVTEWLHGRNASLAAKVSELLALLR